MRRGNIIKFQMLQQTAGGCPTISINPSSITDLTIGQAVTINIVASGGASPYTYAVSSGSLPTGLTLNGSTGVISGTPTTQQAASFTIKATDAEGCTGSKPYSFNTICPTITLSPSSISNMTAGQAQSITITSSGGTAPYTYSVTSGSLPTGLSLNSSTGVISGTPTTAQSASFTITSTDANSCTGNRAYSFSIAFDTDAQAFITAASITDSTQQSAINTLTVGLKADGLWTKMKAVYPFVGGTAASHKFNLINPLDTNAAFRLVFNGGWTHTSGGAQPNGSNGYANTYFIANTLSTSSNHISYYSRTDTAAGDKCEIGVQVGTAPNYEASLFIKHTSNLAYALLGHLQYPSVSNTDSRGLFIGRRIDSTNVILNKNGSKILQAPQTVGLPNYNIFIAAQYRFNGNIAFRYTDRQVAFASIGDGLTDTDATNLYSRVQTYQTTLGRQV